MFDDHARMVFEMIDYAIGFLGPDLEPLKEDLMEQGRRHVDYGVKPEALLVMGQAVLLALDKLLGADFSNKDRDAWKTVLNIFYCYMRMGMNEASAANGTTERCLLPFDSH